MIEPCCEYLSVRCIGSMFLSCHERFPEWIHTLYCLTVRELLARNRLEIWSVSECNWARTHNHLVHKQTPNHLAKLAKWLSRAVSTYLYGTLTVCSYHVTYAFQSESILYCCLNVRELINQNRLEVWSVSHCKWARAHNHLVRKRT